MSEKEVLGKAGKLALEEAINWRDGEPKVPAIPTASKEELLTLFDIGLPETGLNGEEVIERLIKAAKPGLVNNTHPNFYSWVQGSSHPVGVAADFLTSAWGQNGAIYQTSPAAAIAEQVAAGWLLDLLGLPPQSSMAFSTGATMASSICLAVARNEVLARAGYDLNENGLIGAPDLKVFLGEQAHATIFSGLRFLGFGQKDLVLIAADDQGRMKANDLQEKMAAHSGPKIVVCQAGHINSGAFDPFTRICKIAEEHNAWVHVDGAFGLWANAVPELSEQCEGIEQADSWTVDGHKWLQVPYDSGFAIVKHPEAHQKTMDISASYLVRDEADGRNPTHFGPELSRRSRGFAVWAVLQALGRKGVQEMVSRHCRCASHLASRLESVSGIHILNEVKLNQLAISFGDSESIEERNALTDHVIAEIRKENEHFILGAAWKGQTILRISIISLLTDIEQIDTLADSIIRAWERVSH